MSRNNTSEWTEIENLHTKCLCYSETEGLYVSSKNIAPEEDILFIPHGYKGLWKDEHTIADLNLVIRILTNFGHGNKSFLKAIIEKNGKRVLDFDTSKIYILNNCSVMTLDAIPYEWESLFDKIISASKNFNPELCTTSSVAYVEEINKILENEEISFKDFLTKDKLYKCQKTNSVTLYTVNKIRDLIEGCNAAAIVDKYLLDKISDLCCKILSKMQEISLDNLIDQKINELSKSLYIIHDFMIKNNRGIDMLRYFAAKSNIKA